MDYLSTVTENLNQTTFYLLLSVIVLLVVIIILYKTYMASRKVHAQMAEYSSLSKDEFGAKLQLIEVHANEHKLNKKALGPLGKIIDEYCVTTTDNNGVITFANQKYVQLCGYPADEIIGRNISLLKSNHHDAEFWQNLWAKLSQQKVWHGEICNSKKDGTHYWTDTFIFPLPLLSDHGQGYISLSTDITAIKKQNDKLLNLVKEKDAAINKVESLLLHSEKMASLGTMSSGIAHEINNPIAFVASNIDTFNEYLCQFAATIIQARKTLGEAAFEKLLAEINEPAVDSDDINFALDDFSSMVEETRDGINRIRKIVSDLKCFSHEKQEGYAPVDLHKCIETSLNLARNEIKYKAEVVRDFDESIPLLEGSETQLSQVFINLLVNAAHAIDDQGQITIRTKKLENEVSIAISDNGSGIKPETLKTIFEPFFTTKPVGQGTGLGLSISHDIIQRHGGTIKVDSEIGRGTTFTINLPISQQGE
ncbi:MAG: PAS domain-containing protein [Pseudomonadales bacterium]|nr:PAS domain-containing protein [Pseudomonadales bacterium]